MNLNIFQYTPKSQVLIIHKYFQKKSIRVHSFLITNFRFILKPSHNTFMKTVEQGHLRVTCRTTED